MAAKTDIWMPLYIGDYLADTSRLTTEQHGAYLLLIMDYWKNGKLPDNDQVLSQITRLSMDAWSIIRASLEHHFRIENGFWVHHRIEKELLKNQETKSKNHKKAQEAANARWKNAQNDAPSIPQAMLGTCPPQSQSQSQSYSESNSEPQPQPKPFAGVGSEIGAGVEKFREVSERIRNLRPTWGAALTHFERAELERELGCFDSYPWSDVAEWLLSNPAKPPLNRKVFIQGGGTSEKARAEEWKRTKKSTEFPDKF